MVLKQRNGLQHTGKNLLNQHKLSMAQQCHNCWLDHAIKFEEYMMFVLQI